MASLFSAPWPGVRRTAALWDALYASPIPRVAAPRSTGSRTAMTGSNPALGALSQGQRPRSPAACSATSNQQPAITLSPSNAHSSAAIGPMCRTPKTDWPRRRSKPRLQLCARAAVAERVRGRGLVPEAASRVVPRVTPNGPCTVPSVAQARPSRTAGAQSPRGPQTRAVRSRSGSRGSGSGRGRGAARAGITPRRRRAGSWGAAPTLIGLGGAAKLSAHVAWPRGDGRGLNSASAA